MVKSECFCSRFDEEWKVVENVRGQKEYELSAVNWRRLSPARSFRFLLSSQQLCGKVYYWPQSADVSRGAGRLTNLLWLVHGGAGT